MSYATQNLLTWILCIYFIQTVSTEEIRFSNLYQNGMVLQREPEKATIWGYGKIPGGTTINVKCLLNGNPTQFDEALTMIQDDIWQVQIRPLKATTTCNLTLIILHQELLLENVLFGDVYLCSGGTNMEFHMGGIFNSTEEIEDAKRYLDIRYTTVIRNGSLDQDDTMDIDLDIPWSSPQNNLYTMSAVCFMYARYIYDQMKIPLGLIGSYHGDTSIEAWSPQEALDACDIDFENPYYPCHNDTKYVNCNRRLYNKMISPLKRTTLKGFLWYQGEQNIGYNPEFYDCVFPAMINAWRKEFSSSSNTNSLAPFGFVQLSTNEYNSPDMGTTKIRWHQTADYGVVPNSEQDNVFMAVAIDTYDEESGSRPRYKKIIGERLSIPAMNMIYRNKTFPVEGPKPLTPILLNQETIVIEYDKSFSYIISEDITGFYYCCLHFDNCDTFSENWKEIKEDFIHWDNFANTISIYIKSFEHCELQVPHFAYLWKQTPIEGYLSAPIYGKDSFRLPSAPWKLNTHGFSNLEKIK